MKYKYPKTMHLPFSPGLCNDDRVIKTLDHFEGKEIVVTKKMDGENASLYRDGYHARSLDSKHHWTRDWLKRFHAQIAYQIPEGWRICGENLFAQHSLVYDDLKSYFYGFSVWNEQNVAIDWDSTLMMFEDLGITPVEELYRGKYSLKTLVDLATTIDISQVEGFVVRVTDEIPYGRFQELLTKWVRPGHVQTDEHWMHKHINQNGLGV